MRKYVLRRCLVAIPSLVIASSVVVSLTRLLLGELMLEERAYEELKISGQAQAQIA